ncbi:MAG: type IV pilus biogenesis/stability protein PilW [Alicycliphilus sp.]|mgnify:FL=1|jgi:type IV pilus assembly protein PilF|nr:type IV pilus biogenesis/stability protein PilW [Alicycliphilus sp.]MBP8138005.1 type IV pilus biogenesis/stability protein PilW [Alicycliphilus sp.]MBP8778912.1 type IV pilus biogenesis/stability protein PilW [Alicycliphilus sp.]HRM47541.1 type IV pilus biogenesis/stability protein PilW [Alicycliphilus sp.]HRM93271.1 type IV pilus biogenesis/stability protein PilW [Alicycliphilus sp.]
MRLWGGGGIRHGLLAACLAVGAAALGGCAHQAGLDSGVGAAEPVSASGDTDVRRRARIRLELAANYLQMGQTGVALEEVQQALATDPSYADAYHLRGLVYMALADLQGAEDSLKRAQAMRPNDPDIMHNYGWLQCQRQQYAQANQLFERALASPTYASRSKTLMSQGLCYQRAGQVAEAEKTLLRAYEIDAGNPLVGYQLASILLAREEPKRAQFYIRRVNNGEFSNAASLWLGVKVERALGDSVAMRQLGEQLHKRFPDAKETLAFERGAFHE